MWKMFDNQFSWAFGIVSSGIEITDELKYQCCISSYDIHIICTN